MLQVADLVTRTEEEIDVGFGVRGGEAEPNAGRDQRSSAESMR